MVMRKTNKRRLQQSTVHITVFYIVETQSFDVNYVIYVKCPGKLFCIMQVVQPGKHSPATSLVNMLVLCYIFLGVIFYLGDVYVHT